MTQPSESRDPRLIPWRFAGLMLTYWCSARCEFCYVNASPDHHYWADPRHVIEWWQALQRLTERDNRHAAIHLTGGEPFGRPELLFDILDRARHAGLAPPEKIETNAFWANDDAIVWDHLTTLKSYGVPLIVTDADVFHQQFVPLANVRRLVEIATSVLGEGGIRVRWWDFYNENKQHDTAICQDLSADQLNHAQTQALLAGRDRLVGRAAILANKLLVGRSAEQFAGQNCRKAILNSKHVHIDPYGDVFPGTCCGIILGNALNEEISDIYDWLDVNGPSGPVIPALVDHGPVGLLGLAQRFGFVPLEQGYATKCQLCYHIRSTLIAANQCRKWLGPAQCYPTAGDGA